MSFGAADMTAFVDPDMPGYALASIGGVDVAVLFANAYAEAFGMAGSAPSALAVSADVSTVAQNAAVTINGVAYTVAAVEPDGTGMTRLRLAEA